MSDVEVREKAARRVAELIGKRDDQATPAGEKDACRTAIAKLTKRYALTGREISIAEARRLDAQKPRGHRSPPRPGSAGFTEQDFTSAAYDAFFRAATDDLDDRIDEDFFDSALRGMFSARARGGPAQRQQQRYQALKKEAEQLRRETATSMQRANRAMKRALELQEELEEKDKAIRAYEVMYGMRRPET